MSYPYQCLVANFLMVKGFSRCLYIAAQRPIQWTGGESVKQAHRQNVIEWFGALVMEGQKFVNFGDMKLYVMKLQVKRACTYRSWLSLRPLGSGVCLKCERARFKSRPSHTSVWKSGVLVAATTDAFQYGAIAGTGRPAVSIIIVRRRRIAFKGAIRDF